MSYLEVLASFVPGFLVERLARAHVVSLSGSPDAKLPSVTNAEKSQAALLEVWFYSVGPSGPVEDHESIDLEFEQLNCYMEIIIDHILQHGGDIIRQTASSLLVLWNTFSEELSTVVYRAAKCAQVLADLRELSTAFCVGCRVAAGDVYAFWVGRTTFHFVLSGEPFLQLEDYAKQHKHTHKKAVKPGVVLSPEAWEPIRKYCRGEPEMGSNFMRLLSIKREISRPVLCPPLRKIPQEDFTLSFIKQMEQSLRTFIPHCSLAKIDSFFMNDNPLIGGQKHKASRTLNTSLRLPANLAEIRQVTTVCVLFPGLLPSSYSQCLDSVEDLPFMSDPATSTQQQDAIRTLQGIVNFIQSLLHHHEGSLTGLTVDSEGTKITITFGLFPFLHEDDPLRAVLLGLELKALNEPNQVGIATSRVLSALIGSKQRRAFAVAGGCAQRAAYLMACSAGVDHGVVCDKETYRISRCLNRCRDADLLFERFNNTGPNNDEPDDEFKAYNSDSDERGEVFLVHLKNPTVVEPEEEDQLYVNTRPPPFKDLEKELQVVKEITVGRAKEKQLLKQRFEILMDEGEGSFIVVEGEGGIGKTNLIHDFLMKASNQSITTLYGAADPLNKSAPHDVWKGIFQAMMEQEDIPSCPNETESEFDDEGGDYSDASEWSCTTTCSGRSERGSGMYEYEEECTEQRRISGLKFNFDYSRKTIYEDEEDFLGRLVEEKRRALPEQEAVTAYPSPPVQPYFTPYNPLVGPGAPHGVAKQGDESGEFSTRKKQEKKKKTRSQVEDYIYNQLQLEEKEILAPLLNDVLSLRFPENELTMQMPLETRIEKTNDMLLYLLQDPTEDPKIIILENAHNFHPASWALLNSVAKNLSSVLFILTTRELIFEFQKEEMKKLRRAIGVDKEAPIPFARQSLKQMKKPLYPFYEVNLSPIPMEGIVKLVAKQHNLKTIPTHLLSAFGKSEGHPLLALEMAQSLKDVSLRKSGEGLSPHTLQAVDPEQAFNGSAFSSTLQRMIAQRLDLLKPTEQLTLKVASVFGDTFSFADLIWIYPSARSKEHIMEDINSLIELKILKQQPLLPLVEDMAMASSSNSSGNIYKDKKKESKKRRRRVAITECRCNITRIKDSGDDALSPAPSLVASGGLEGDMTTSGGCSLSSLGCFQDEEDWDELSSTGTDSTDDDSKVIYCFTQGVTRETVYNSIIYSQRRGFHGSVVELYETKFLKLGERGLEPFYGLLAEHCIKAGNWLKAMDYLEKAADKALEASANKDAVALLQKVKETAKKFGGYSSSSLPPLSPSSIRRGTGGGSGISIPSIGSGGSGINLNNNNGNNAGGSNIKNNTNTATDEEVKASKGEGEITRLRAAGWERKLGEAFLALRDLEQADSHMRAALVLLGHQEESGGAGWVQYQLVGEIIKQFAKKKLLSSSKKKNWATPPKDFMEMLELTRCYFLLGQIRYFANDFYAAYAMTMKSVKFAEMAAMPSKELARGYAAMCYVTSCASLKSLSKQFCRSSLEITENCDDARTVLDVLLMTSHYYFANAKWKAIEKRLGKAVDICFCSCGQTNTVRKQNVLLFFAAYRIARGQHSQALALYDDIARRKQGDDSASLALSLLGKAISLAYLGQLEEAQEILYHQNIKTFFGRQEIIFRQVLCALILLRRRDYMSARDTILSIFEQLKDKTIALHLDSAFFWCDFEILSFALEVCLLLWEYDLCTGFSVVRERSRTVPVMASEQPALSASAVVSNKAAITAQWTENCNKLIKMLHKYTKIFVAAKPRWMRFTSAVKHLTGHPKAAQRGWQKALDSADKLGMAYECGVIRLWMGRALTGESDKKKKYLELAMQVFARDEKGYYLSWCQEELDAIMTAPLPSSSSSSSVERKEKDEESPAMVSSSDIELGEM